MPHLQKLKDNKKVQFIPKQVIAKTKHQPTDNIYLIKENMLKHSFKVEIVKEK